MKIRKLSSVVLLSVSFTLSSNSMATGFDHDAKRDRNVAIEKWHQWNRETGTEVKEQIKNVQLFKEDLKSLEQERAELRQSGQKGAILETVLEEVDSSVRFIDSLSKNKGELMSQLGKLQQLYPLLKAEEYRKTHNTLSVGEIKELEAVAGRLQAIDPDLITRDSDIGAHMSKIRRKLSELEKKHGGMRLASDRAYSYGQIVSTRVSLIEGYTELVKRKLGLINQVASNAISTHFESWAMESLGDIEIGGDLDMTLDWVAGLGKVSDKTKGSNVPLMYGEFD